MVSFGEAGALEAGALEALDDGLGVADAGCPVGSAGVNAVVEVELDEEGFGHIKADVSVRGLLVGILGLVLGDDILKVGNYLTGDFGTAELSAGDAHGGILVHVGDVAEAVDCVVVCACTEDAGLTDEVLGEFFELLVAFDCEVAGIDNLYELVAAGDIDVPITTVLLAGMMPYWNVP